MYTSYNKLINLNARHKGNDNRENHKLYLHPKNKGEWDYYWENRIVNQLKFAMQVALNTGSFEPSLIEEACKIVYDYLLKEKTIDKGLVLNLESELTPKISAILKKYTIHCVAHAHIDLNWTWGYHETVSIVQDTMRTMLNLMKEFPEFHFSQSQGALYEIIEEFEPEMIEEIKKYVHEGRWELSASNWVEGEKNIVNGESLVRQVMYSKEYLSKLFDVDIDSVSLDFEPDTFGHSANIPEILSQAGVKYYYFCRGYCDEILFNWRSKSGGEVITFREPQWYQGVIMGDFSYIPSICNKYGMEDMLYVYGVGDHGGGPTRRDLLRIKDMMEWPLLPNLEYSTYSNFFEKVEEVKESLPVVDKELNFAMTGCYTVMSRMKMANKYGENVLFNAELNNIYSSLLFNAPYRTEILKRSWKKILFNQFHDILPGCGVDLTREYALGEFQKVLANANNISKKTMRQIVDNIDLSKLPLDLTQDDNETSYGAGAGTSSIIDLYGQTSFSYHASSMSCGSGNTRVFVLFNNTTTQMKKNTKIVIWDYLADLDNIEVCSSSGKKLPHTVKKAEYSEMWAHYYTELLIEVEVPTFGYETVVVKQKENDEAPILPPRISKKRNNEWKYEPLTLESDYLKAEFEEESMALVSLIDKGKDKEYLDKNNPSNFNFILEDLSGSNAWHIGRYSEINRCKKDIKNIRMVKNALEEVIYFDLHLDKSVLEIAVTLDKNSSQIEYSQYVKWNQTENEVKTPQLTYKLNLKDEVEEFTYDIPMGIMRRKPVNDDVPGLNFSLASKGEKGIYICAESKYGYRTTNKSMALTLLRSPSNPEKYTDIALHNFKFFIGIGNLANVTAESDLVRQPILAVSVDTTMKGELPLSQSLFRVNNENIRISSIKAPEYSNSDTLFRIYNISDQVEEVVITCPKEVGRACIVDVLERKIETKNTLEVNGNKILLKANPHQMINITVNYE